MTGYRAFAGTCSVLTGASGVLYAIAFVVSLRRDSVGADRAAAFFLLAGGLLAVVVYIGLHSSLRDRGDDGFATLALVFGIASGVGAALHGGYDLARSLNPPRGRVPEVPSEIDPRGLLTFLAAAIAIALFARLMRGSIFPAALSTLGYVTAALLTLLYLGQLILADGDHPFILVVGVLSGVIALPAWYVWVGLALRRRDAG